MLHQSSQRGLCSRKQLGCLFGQSRILGFSGDTIAVQIDASRQVLDAPIGPSEPSVQSGHRDLQSVTRHTH
jgi:hypothetical protein